VLWLGGGRAAPSLKGSLRASFRRRSNAPAPATPGEDRRRLLPGHTAISLPILEGGLNGPHGRSHAWAMPLAHAPGLRMPDHAHRISVCGEPWAFRGRVAQPERRGIDCGFSWRRSPNLHHLRLNPQATPPRARWGGLIHVRVGVAVLDGGGPSQRRQLRGRHCRSGTTHLDANRVATLAGRLWTGARSLRGPVAGPG
jgi:hypothetical protein